jgi:hypothetical protein
MPKPKDNIDFVKDLMSVNKYGALAQLFVLDALDKWSEMVAKADPATLNSPMINGHAWVGVAKEIQQKLNERLGPQ